MSVEFSIPVHVAELSPQGITAQREANPEERAALSERLNVDAVDELKADVSIIPQADEQTVAVQGRLEAAIVQKCSVSLEPIVTTHDIAVDLLFTDEETVESQDIEEVDAEEDDPPEPIVDGYFDVGETLVQVLAVEIDPFPRKPGLSLDDIPEAAKLNAAQDDDTDNPFAVLSEFRDKLENR